MLGRCEFADKCSHKICPRIEAHEHYSLPTNSDCEWRDMKEKNPRCVEFNQDPALAFSHKIKLPKRFN